MKKELILGLVAVFGFVTAGFAAPTVLNTTWDFYGGGFNINFDSGDDASVIFNTGGAHAWGSFSGADYDDNPYTYNVDTTRAQVRANVEGGGMVWPASMPKRRFGLPTALLSLPAALVLTLLT